MSMSDRIVVMNEGKIEQVDSPVEIYRHPATVFVADFIGRANFLKVDAASSEGEGWAKVAVLGEEFSTPAAPDTLSGQSVLLVRPESIRLARATGQSIGGRVGRVLSAVFFGESVEYIVETAQGNVTAVEADPDEVDMLDPGDFVEVGFEHKRTWLLPA